MSLAHLILRLDAPLMSFGGITVDNFGRTDTFPATSLVTGLVANALGYDRTEGARLDELQARMVHAARIDRPGQPLMDYQTVKLSSDDEGWTTRGKPEGRGGGSSDDTHIRYRDFWADRIVMVALRLAQNDGGPTLDVVAAALEDPARPLFIGRKPCLPFSPLLCGTIEAPSVLAALESIAFAQGAEPDASGRCEAYWPQGEHDGRTADCRTIRLNGLKNWTSGVHGGEQRWLHGLVTPQARSEAAAA